MKAMSVAQLAKRRSRLRRTQSGAIMFILAVTMAVLASLGLYAMKAASTEVKTSGFLRQSAQSQYLSEYGVLASTQSMGGTLGQMQIASATSATHDTGCISLGSIVNTAGFRSQTCRRVGALEVQNMLWNGSPVTPIEKYQTNVRAGGLGPFPIEGDYFVELTDPARRESAPGNGGLNMCFVETTLSAYGRTQPDVFALGLVNGQEVAGQNLQLSRARIIAGPMRCQ